MNFIKVIVVIAVLGLFVGIAMALTDWFIYAKPNKKKNSKKDFCDSCKYIYSTDCHAIYTDRIEKFKDEEDWSEHIIAVKATRHDMANAWGLCRYHTTNWKDVVYCDVCKHYDYDTKNEFGVWGVCKLGRAGCGKGECCPRGERKEK